MMLNLSIDEVLTTTRAVRKRLDTSRPVPRALLEECLDLALQAPNGSNRNDWRWIIVDDPALVKKLADEYRAAMGVMQSGTAPSTRYLTGNTPREDMLLESAYALVEKLDDETDTLYVTTGKTPYVVKLEGLGGDSPGYATFTDFGKKPHITAPPASQTLDMADLGIEPYGISV